MWLFLLLLQSLIGFAFSDRFLRIHQANVVKPKCESLPFRSLYEHTKCYFAVGIQVPYEEGSRMCHSALFGAVMDTTPASRPALSVLFLEPSNYHNAFSRGQSKGVLCRYESPSTCTHEELKGVSGKCVTLLHTKMTFTEAKQHCDSLENSRLATIRNDDENKAFAGFIPDNNGGAWIQKSHPAAMETNQYFRWFIGHTAKPQCGTDTGINIFAAKSGSCANFGYWQETPMTSKANAFCVRPSGGDFAPVAKKPVKPVKPVEARNTTTTSTARATTKCDATVSEPISAKMLTRLGKEDSELIKTDGAVKVIAQEKMHQAIKECGCAAKHLSFAGRTVTGALQISNGQIGSQWPLIFQFGLSARAGACGATIPVNIAPWGKGKMFIYAVSSIKEGRDPWGMPARSLMPLYAWP